MSPSTSSIRARAVLSENFIRVPHRPVGAGFQDAMASSEIQRVISPRWTRARSYSAQLLTRYFVLYLGWTLEFMLRMWRIGSKGPQGSGQGFRSSLGFMHQRRPDGLLIAWTWQRRFTRDQGPRGRDLNLWEPVGR